MTKEYTSRTDRKQQEQALKEEKKKQNKQKKKPSKSKWWKKAILILLACFILAIIVISVTIINMILNTPDLKASDLETPLSTQIYNQDDELIGTMFEEENRVKVDIDDVPDEMKEAIVSIEDKRYYDHNGFDFQRLLKAAYLNLKLGLGAEAGHTISQQVNKRNVLSSEKTLNHKMRETWLAIELERQYSKEETLEIYMNNVYLG